MDKKKWFLSKTLWVNTLAVILFVLENTVGITPGKLDVNTQAIILAIINGLLRIKTNKPVGL